MFCYRNDGGNFDSLFLIVPSNLEILSLTHGDMDEDGDFDIVLFDNTNQRILWYENQGNLNFNTTPTVALNATIWYSDLRIIDMDNDQDMDIIAWHPWNGNLYWLENINNSDQFESPEVVSDLMDSNGCWFADLDQDMDIDMVCNEDGNLYNTAYYLNSGNGFFDQKLFLTNYINNTNHIAGADIDNDGDEDYFVASGGVVWIENLDGTGENFSAPKDIEENTSTIDPYRVFPYDVDTDGDMDLIAAWDSDGLRWYENTDGTGIFGVPQFIHNKSSDFTFLEDMDNDGDKDLLSFHSQPHEVRWTENDGNGFSTVHVISTTSNILINPKVVDYDQDGDNDIICQKFFEGNTIYWFKNNNGTFDQLEQVITQADDFKNLLYEDIDNDGWTDILFTENVSQFVINVLWQRNLQGFGFNPKEILIEDIDGLQKITPIDVDGNGYPDLISDQANIYFNYFGQFAEGQYLASLDSDISTSRIFTGNINNNGGNKDLIIYDFPFIYWVDNFYQSYKTTAEVFWDQNENGIKDANEINLLNQKVELSPNALTSWTDNFGQSNFILTEGDYMITVVPDSGWFSTNNSEYDFSIDSINSIFYSYFGINNNSNLTNTKIDVISGPTRCDQIVPYWLHIQNEGFEMASGQVKVVLDETVVLQATSVMPDQMNNDTLIFNFENIAPTYDFSFRIDLLMPDFNSIGDTLSMWTEVFTVGMNGELLLEDTQTYASELLCSYDPNDKLVNKVIIDFDIYEIMGDQLEYTIRFQNTGNDTAFNVRLEDQLSTQLDWATVDFLNSSHPCIPVLDEFGLLTFYFDDILLPDSITNPVGSNGFVKFRVRLKTGLDEFEVIENTASIFFDSNPPIITNTIETILEKLVSTATIPKDWFSDMTITPNPNQGICTATFKSPNNLPWEIKIYNSVGILEQRIFSNQYPTLSEKKEILIQMDKKGLKIMTLEIGHQTISKKVMAF